VVGFSLLPLWWGLGISGVVIPALVLPLAVSIVYRRRLAAPRGFVLYLAFLGWAAVSAVQLDSGRQGFSLAYRASIYLAAALLFLYVLNTPAIRLPTATVVHVLAGFFTLTVIGGLAGMVVPNVALTTPARSLLPPSLLADGFVSDLTSAATSSGRAFAAYPIFRPKLPFIYANEWGAAYAMSLPFAIAALSTVRRKLTRDLLAMLLVVSIFPLVFSLNRGAWLSAGAAMLYATFRMARGRNAQLLRIVAVGALVIGAVFFLTPLGEIVQTRLTNGYGDAHRERLYAQSIELVRESPIFGHGAPVLVEGNLSAGTHGQLWTVLVSQGIPGVVFFVGWLAWAWWASSRRLPPGHPGNRQVRLWCEVAVFTAIVQMPYYDLLPWGLSIAMVATALALREAVAPVGAVVVRPQGARPRGWVRR
jgi:O-antigen ligase